MSYVRTWSDIKALRFQIFLVYLYQTRAIRQSNGHISIGLTARYLNVDTKTLRSWLKGNTYPSSYLISRIASGFNIDLSVFQSVYTKELGLINVPTNMNFVDYKKDVRRYFIDDNVYSIEDYISKPVDTENLIDYLIHYRNAKKDALRSFKELAHLRGSNSDLVNKHTGEIMNEIIYSIDQIGKKYNFQDKSVPSYEELIRSDTFHQYAKWYTKLKFYNQILASTDVRDKIHFRQQIEIIKEDNLSDEFYKAFADNY